MPVRSSSSSHMNWLVEPKVAPTLYFSGLASTSAWNSAQLFCGVLAAAPTMSGV